MAKSRTARSAAPSRTSTKRAAPAPRPAPPPSSTAVRARAAQRAIRSGSMSFNDQVRYENRRFGRRDLPSMNQRAREFLNTVNRNVFAPGSINNAIGQRVGGLAIRGSSVTYNPQNGLSRLLLSSDPLRIAQRLDPNTFVGGSAPRGFAQTGTRATQSRTVTGDGGMDISSLPVYSRMQINPVAAPRQRSEPAPRRRNRAPSREAMNEVPRRGVPVTSAPTNPVTAPPSSSANPATPDSPGVNARLMADQVGLRAKRSRVRMAGTLNRGTSRMIIPRTSGASSLNISR